MAETLKKLSPVMYLKKQLNFTSKEWLELTDFDKKELKAWAQAEMDAAS